ncbi:MAG: tetratricopeptide repeat protein [Magnetococcales bacterium]|nr:tetratricopeptide repeat protein [Magnetococcales bacterium]
MPEQMTLEDAINLGMQHHQAGALNEAESIYRTILDADPNQSDALHLLGLIAQQVGQLEESKRLLEKALKANPKHAAAHHNLGITMNLLGDHRGSEMAHKDALRLLPHVGGFHLEMGRTLQSQNRLTEALGYMNKALELAPNTPNLLGEIGAVQLMLGNSSEAIPLLRQALDAEPNALDAANNLGNALRESGDLVGSIEVLQRALAMKPDFPEAHNNLGYALREMGRFEEAEASFRKATQLRPNDIGFSNNLGVSLKLQGKLQEAVDLFETALAQAPDDGELHHNLATTLIDQGRIQKALVHYKKSLEARITPLRARNTINALLYQPETSQQELFEAARLHVKAILQATKNSDKWPSPSMDHHVTTTSVDLERIQPETLRVGYLSSDLRDHPVGRNMAPLLFNHNPENVEIFCYSSTPNSDQLTKSFKASVPHWRDVYGLDDRQLAEQILQDKLHILVHLATHFDGNQLATATHRPAPIQVSFHNGTTTALNSMDYWLSDELLHPTEEYSEKFSEQLFRLPNFYVFPAINNAPEIHTPPHECCGQITFISLNHPAKINLQVAKLWTNIILALPEAKLILKYRNRLDDPGTKKHLVSLFSKAGLAQEKLDLRSVEEDHQNHLSLYHEADIALDPFPYTGATTTFQALWMGVPTISLLGRRFIGRMAADILHHAGLSELIADTEELYVEHALSLAKDHQRLRELRQGLRQRLQSSPLLNGPGYARHVESAYRSMWKYAHSQEKQGDLS